MTKRTLFSLSITLLLVSFLITSRVRAQENGEDASKNDRETYKVHYPQGVELAGFVDFVAKVTDKKIIYEPSKLKGTVSIISQANLPEDAVFDLLHSVLESHGFALQEETIGEKDEVIYKVRSKGQALSRSEVMDEEELPRGERLVSKVFQLEYADVENTRRAIEKVVTGETMAIDTVNALIVTDYAPSIERVTRIIDLMDQPLPGPDVNVVSLEHANPKELGSLLNKIAPGLIQDRSGGQRRQREQQLDTRIVPHSGTQSLVIMARSEDMKSLMNIVEKLDRREGEGGKTTHYYHLTTTTPQKASEVLKGLFQSSFGKQGEGQSEGNRGGPQFEVLNSRNLLLVRTSDKTWENEVKPVLDRIDRRQDQVLISSAVVELTSNHNTPRPKPQDLQTKYLSKKKGGSELVNILPDRSTNYLDLDGDGEVDFYRPHVKSERFMDLFSAARARIPMYAKLFHPDRVTDVSQLPFLVTDNHKNATLSVMKEYPTGALQEEEGKNGDNSYSFNEYVKAGVELSFTPDVSKEGHLRLSLTLQFDQFLPEQQSQAAKEALQPPPRTTRSLSSTVTIPDRKTIVLGGISLQSHAGDGASGTRTLWGGGGKENTSQRTMYLFITPYILSNDNFEGLETHSDVYRSQAQMFLDQSGKGPSETDEQNGNSGFKPLKQFQFDSPYEDE